MKKNVLRRVVALVVVLAMLVLPTASVDAASNVGGDGPSIEYTVHVQDIGDRIATSGMTGGNGQGKRMEQIAVTLKNAPADSYVALRVHIAGDGWTPYSTKNGMPMGTRGQSKALECVQATLKGSIANSYRLVYRVHVAELGDLGWVDEGFPAGSTGCAVNAEAVEFKLVKKGEAGPATSNSKGYFEMPRLSGLVHIENEGDRRVSADSTGMLVLGTTGKSLAIEGLDVDLPDILTGAQAISQRLHLAYTGWEPSFTTGFSGTRGQSRRAEAAQFRLSGNVAKLFDLMVSGHVENIGDQPWTLNSCGTESRSLRLECIRLKLVRKSSNTANSQTPSAQTASSQSLHTGRANGKVISESFAANSGYCACGRAKGSAGHICCWRYASRAFAMIWDTGLFHQSNTSIDMLRNVPAESRRLTADNLKKYLSRAVPGANFRMDKDPVNSSYDQNGHSMIFMGVDSSLNGAWWLDANYNGTGLIKYRYLTFEQLAREKAKYTYIKYISWPGAPAF